VVTRSLASSTSITFEAGQQFGMQALMTYDSANRAQPGLYDAPTRSITLKIKDVNSAVLVADPFDPISDVANSIKGRMHVVDGMLIPRDRIISLGGEKCWPQFNGHHHELSKQ